MPTLLTRKKDQLQAGALPCDFSNPLNNELTSQETSIAELKALCERYRVFLASLTPSQENSMIRASSFTADSIREMLDSSPDSAFFRVYYGIREDGEHLLFMGPVKDESEPMASFTGELSNEEDGVWVENCCACPPRLNCPRDPLIDEQP